MRNSPGLVRMEVVGTAETGIEGMAETGVVGMAETGAMGVAGAAAGGIPTSTMTLGPSKVSAKHGNRHTNKGRLQQRGDANTYV